MRRDKDEKEIAITPENKHLSKGFGLCYCDSCGNITGNCRDEGGIALCDDCKESV